MNRVLSMLMLAALVATSATARAADPPDRAASPSPPPAPSEPGAFPDSVTSHTITLDGKVIPYTARAGLLALRDQEGKLTAQVFYTAYTADGANPMTRPVTFIYNGGPGSSTMWLRMGSFGPVRVVAGDGEPTGPPPYHIVENKYSLLDKSDLVFIDMPDSGFGRIMPGVDLKTFFGVDQDVAQFGQFITNYISKFGRWNSPKFLFGESYGTPRSAVLSSWLVDHGIALNGVILQSSILNFGLDYGNGDPIGGGDWPYVLYLPTEAAAAWFHNRINPRPADLSSFVSDVEQFAMGEYLDALYKGDKVGGAELDDVVRKLSQYTGLSQQYVRRSHIRIPYFQFQAELLRNEGQAVGRLDARYQTWSLDRASVDGPPWDPTDAAIDAPYTTAINQYLREDLRYNPPIPYRANIYDIIYGAGFYGQFNPDGWDFSHNGRWPTNTAPDLAAAMAQNPDLKVFSANGYYDFATPFFATVYTLKHLNLSPQLQQNITFGFYQAGHMIYLSEPALAQYKADLARWYDSALGH
jgi:carboxypeptidase C (cathepsin A)